MIEQSVIFVRFTSEEDNLQGWFFAEDDGNQIKKQKHPLLLRQMPVVMSKLQEFKVRHFIFLSFLASLFYRKNPSITALPFYTAFNFSNCLKPRLLVLLHNF